MTAAILVEGGEQMSQAVLETVIRASNQFQAAFVQFNASLKDIAKSEEQVGAASRSVNEAMGQMAASKTRAMQAAQQLQRVLQEMAKGQRQGAAATAEFEKALNELGEAEQELERHTKELNASLAAHGITGATAQMVIGEMGKATLGLGTDASTASLGLNGLTGSADQLLLILSQVGVLYAFKSAISQIGQAGREFELSIRQSEAVMNDFSGNLEEAATRASNGIYGPTMMAQAYYQLGSAGLSANETIGATPEILDFATAGLLDLDAAAYTAISTVKAFRLSWSDTGDVMDSFTKAMNSTTLEAKDFQWVMSSAGSVANMAGQDFREVVAAAAALKDSGVQAQDGGTAIKSALMQLINPSDEARQMMVALGIELTDSQGKMKQWSAIVAEFEQALAGMSQATQNQVLASIAGTDGVRALAASLNMGSGTLANFVQEMSRAEGATREMAEVMSNTFDGAARQASASMERAKVSIFSDWRGVATSATKVLGAFAEGVAALPAPIRIVITSLIGTVGLAVALATVTTALNRLGISVAMLKGLLSPFNLVVMGVTVLLGSLAAGYSHASSAAAELAAKQATLNTENETQIGALTSLQAEYNELSAKTRRTKDEQERLNEVTAEIIKLVPDAARGTDQFGNVLVDSKVAAKGLTDQINELKDAVAGYYAMLADQAGVELKGTESTLSSIDQRLSALKSERLRAGETPAILPGVQSDDIAPGQVEYIRSSKAIDGEIARLSVQRAELQKRISELKADQDRWAAIQKGDYDWGIQTSGTGEPSGGTGGTVNFDLAGSKLSAGLDAAFTASEKWINHMKALEKLSAAQEVDAWARVAQRYTQGSEERMRADEQLYAAKKRLLQEDEKLQQEVERLQQDAFQSSMELYRHEVAMSRMSVDQQITYLQKLQGVQGLTMRQTRELNESLFKLRKQQMEDWLGDLELEHERTLTALETRTKSTVASLQAQIDALEESDRATDRADAATQHEERLADLLKQKQYHELRSGREHQEALQDLDKQIVEENRDWQRQQADWQRDDKKRLLEQQIRDVELAADKQKAEYEAHYREAKRIAESGMTDVIAALASTGPQWMETGKALIDQLIAGLSSGDFSGVTQTLDQIRQGLPPADVGSSEPSPTDPTGESGSSDLKKQAAIILYSSEYSMQGTEAVMQARQLAAKLGVSAGWDAAKRELTMDGQQVPYRYLTNDGKAVVGVRDTLESLGLRVEYDPAERAIKAYKAATGAFFEHPALTQVAEAGEAEVVAPLSRFQPMLNQAVARAMDTSSVEETVRQGVDRIVSAIGERLGVFAKALVNIEHFTPEDDTDVEILGRELGHLIGAAVRTKG